MDNNNWQPKQNYYPFCMAHIFETSSLLVLTFAAWFRGFCCGSLCYCISSKSRISRSFPSSSHGIEALAFLFFPTDLILGTIYCALCVQNSEVAAVLYQWSSSCDGKGDQFQGSRHLFSIVGSVKCTHQVQGEWYWTILHLLRNRNDGGGMLEEIYWEEFENWEWIFTFHSTVSNEVRQCYGQWGKR